MTTIIGGARLAALITLLGAAPAFAHVTLETREAAAGATYKAVLRVPHGCAGAATTAIRVQIPPGVIAVKPMPKPGWELTTTIGPYDQPAQHFGATLTEGVKEIDWTGGNLPDAWYDEFVFQASLPDAPAGTAIYFPVVQECGTAVERWIEIPEAGKSPDDYENPAPHLTLTAGPASDD